MTKEEATKKYYDLMEQCKIEDVDCIKYNYHHIEPLFELKEKLGVKTTKEIRGTKFDNSDLLKCSVKIWDKEICSCNALGQWWDKNSNHEIVNGLSKKEFLRKYILIDSEGNYIYDEETALNIIHNNIIDS